jgi:hypothetical protein
MITIDQLNYYLSITTKREKQVLSVYNSLKDNFKFNKIECIETGASQDLEDGCFGLYLGKIAEESNGVFISIDIDENVIDKSKLLYNKYLPNLNIHNYISDSVEFLKNYKGSPNLVHLDSYDLDLKNPINSMLHCWLEFNAIKDKMDIGSIVLIDDNFLKGTWVEWNYTNGESEIININYDIIGKGSLIYHWVKNYNTEWCIIGDHYHIGENIKIILMKK